MMTFSWMASASGSERALSPTIPVMCGTWTWPSCPRTERLLGQVSGAGELRQKKAIMGIFDEGCMGMYNAIIEDELLNACGIYKERLSQSALVAGMRTVADDEACRLSATGWMSAA